MAKKIREPRQWLEGIHKEREEWEKNPKVAERWRVVERDPDWYDWGYYGRGYMPGEARYVTGWLDSEAAAQEFIDTHEPDKVNGVFEIEHEVGREVKVIQWRRA